MTYPREFFSSGVSAERSGTCFVMMPFAQEFAAIHEAIACALESEEAGFRCRRADEFFGGHQVMQDVLHEIATSELIVADVTGRNPNVFYELGIAHTVKSAKRVLLITQCIDDVPFDLRAYRHIVYSTDAQGLSELKKTLRTAAREVCGMCYRFTLTANPHYSSACLRAGGWAPLGCWGGGPQPAVMV